MPTKIPSVSTFTTPVLTAAVDPERNPTGAAAFWLKRDIIRGVFAPEERLAVDFLAGFYGVGYSPMREALLTLSSSDLVVHEHQRGRFVAPVSLADWRDVFDNYQRIFRMILHLAVERGDQAWEERVVVYLYRAMKAGSSAPPQDPQALEVWHTAHRALHDEMRSGANSAIASKFLNGVSDQLERYIYMFGDRTLERERDHHAQHRVFVDALLSRDLTRLDQVFDEYLAYGEAVRNSVTARLTAIEAGPASAAPTAARAARARAPADKSAKRAAKA